MVSKRNKKASELIKEFKTTLDELGFDYVICVEDMAAMHVKKSNVPLRQLADNYIQFRKDQERAEYTQMKALEKLRRMKDINDIFK